MSLATFLQPQAPRISPLQPKENPRRVQVDLLRIDEVHPLISGNKWYKLKYNLLKAQQEGFTTLLTFGGAYSNHILATAAAAKEAGFKAISIIRGEETLPLNPTLRQAAFLGMQLQYVSRALYRKKKEAGFIETLQQEHGSFYLVPEGGTNKVAIRGAEEILTEALVASYDYVVCAVGTGGTLTGLITKTNNYAKVVGIPVLKGHFLKQEVRNWLVAMKKEYVTNWELVTDYHFGGYAKYTRELIAFINNFKQQYQIPLDPVYTGKMMYAVMAMVANQKFEPNSKILAIHTGGLQGIAGFNKRFGHLIV